MKKYSTSLIASLSRRLLSCGMAFLLLSGCLSMSASSGGKAGAEAKTSQSSSSDASLDNDTAMELHGGGLVWKMKEGKIDPNGEMRFEMPMIKVKSGSKTAQKSDDKQEAMASAMSEMQSEAKASANMNFIILMVVAGLALVYLFKGGIFLAKKKVGL